MIPWMILWLVYSEILPVLLVDSRVAAFMEMQQ